MKNLYDALEEQIDSGQVDTGAPEAQPPANPYLQLEDAIDKDDAAKDESLRKLFDLGLQVPPDRKAGILYLSRETGLHPGLVESQYDLIEKQVRAAQFDPKRFRDENPELASLLLENPSVSGVAMQDQQISGFARVMKALRRLDAFGDELTVPGASPDVIRWNLEARSAQQDAGEWALPPAPSKEQLFPPLPKVPTRASPYAESEGLRRVSICSEAWGRARSRAGSK